MWALILIVGSSPSDSSVGYVEWSSFSTSKSGTKDLPHREADRTPSTHCKISMPIFRTFRFLDLQENGSGAFVWFEILSESNLGLRNEVLSSGWMISPGRAASIRGSDGKSNGSICLESNNSPSTRGGRTGSHVDLSSDLSNNISMLCWAEVVAIEGVIEGVWLEMLAVSFAKEDMLPSRSRPRSLIYKDVSFPVLPTLYKEKPLFLKLQPLIWLDAFPNLSATV